MASGTTNWVHEKGVVTEKDRIALERAQRIEKKQEKMGYRWYKINERNKIFIPFGKDGKPTKGGYAAIERYKAYLGIK